MIKVTIDGRTVFLEKPLTVLEAADLLGVRIPRLCHMEGLTPWGGCRLCLVEIEKVPKLQTACTTMVTDGMIVRTETPVIQSARRFMLELLLINHPLECPYCDKAGECELQDMVARYGPSQGRFREGKRQNPESFEDPLIVRTPERCILCMRCVRMCEELQGASSIVAINRGDRSIIEPFSGGRFDCDYCGNCLTACPVGALTSRLSRHIYREWFVENILSICELCGSGCSLLIQMRGEDLIRTWSPEIQRGINSGLTCVMGRFGYDILKSPERVKEPLIKKDNRLAKVSLDEALDYVSRRLKEIRHNYGPNSIAFIAGGRLTNEEAYLLQKFARGTGTNNISSISETGRLQLQLFFEEVFGQGFTSSPLRGILNSDTILITGGDPLRINPVPGVYIRQSYRNGAYVVSCGLYDGIRNHSSVEFMSDRIWKDEGDLLYGIARRMIDIKGMPENGLLKRLIESTGWMELRGMDHGLMEVVENLLRGKNTSIIVGNGIIQRRDYLINLISLGVIASITDARVYLLQEYPNEQGIIDMGCNGEYLPGWRPIHIDVMRRRYEEAWGFRISDERGLRLYEILESIEKGKIKALYVAGIDPVSEIPSGGKIAEILKRLEFFVIQDAFYGDSFQYSHAIIPMSLWIEREGTYTNLERRLQYLSPAMKESEYSGWYVISGLLRRFNVRSEYKNIRDVWREITHVAPIYGNIDYDDIKQGILWPYRGEPLRGVEPYIEKWLEDTVVRDQGKERRLKILLEKDRYLSATISRYSKFLINIWDGAYIRMSGNTLSKEGLNRESEVYLRGVHGGVRVRVRVDDALPDGVVIAKSFYPEKGLFTITDCEWSRYSGVPFIDTFDLSIEKV